MQSKDGPPASKAEFVWLMLELARRDRALYRRLRAEGWEAAALARVDLPESDKPN